MKLSSLSSADHFTDHPAAAIAFQQLTKFQTDLSVRMIQEMIAHREQAIGTVLDAISGRNGREDDKRQQNPPDMPGGQEPQVSGAAQVSSRSKPLLLIVDDQATIRALLSVALCDDYAIIEAGDGEEALAKAIEHRPDLIITDVVMPRMGAVGLLEAVRQHPLLRSTPVVAMSGYHEPEVRQRLQELGIAAFWQKPFPIRQVPDLVREALQRRNQA